MNHFVDVPSFPFLELFRPLQFGTISVPSFKGPRDPTTPSCHGFSGASSQGVECLYPDETIGTW